MSGWSFNLSLQRHAEVRSFQSAEALVSHGKFANRQRQQSRSSSVGKNSFCAPDESGGVWGGVGGGW